MTEDRKNEMLSAVVFGKHKKIKKSLLAHTYISIY